MMIFIEQDKTEPQYFEAGKSLAEKLSQEAKPNAIIPLTRIEMELMKDAHVVGMGESKGHLDLIPIDPSTMYIAVCDQSVNIDDIIQAGFLVKIVRTRGK